MLDKYIVAQIGARRGYAVPALLEQAGMLEYFFTDVCANVGLGRPLATLARCMGVAGRWKQLAARRLPPEIIAKTRTFGWPTARHEWRMAVGSAETGSGPGAYPQWSEEVGRAMMREDFGHATHLFSMLDECGPLLAEARRRGLRVTSEIYILLATERILSAERKAFPGWESGGMDFQTLDCRFLPEERLLEQTDFAICPSEAVRDDLTGRCGFPADRTRLVPYGVSPDWLTLAPTPQRGRVLFVGSAELRKGIHYLAMAAEKLAAKGHQFDFRVVGAVANSVRQQPVCKHLSFLGRLPRDLVQEEFQKADVFVLPSLAEGSAEVTYEALASGVPLVVTAAAGSVATNGVEGFIVPERDPEALSAAIERTIEDRELRAKMALAARQRAHEYTWERYGGRLIAALQEFSK